MLAIIHQLTRGLLVALFLPATYATAEGTSSTNSRVYYVSPSGKDDAPGTKERPFATVLRAREEVRRLKYSGQYPDKGVTVYLREGRYELQETLEFTPADSGKPGAPVVYASAPGEQARLCGGRIVRDWQQEESGLWKASVEGPFRQLYVNDSRAMRARSPNDIHQYYRVKKWQKESKIIEVPLVALSELKKAAGAEMLVQNEWSRSILHIQSVEQEGDKASVVVKNPERDLIFSRYAPWNIDGNPFHLENNLSLLDMPGEWYLDREQSVVFYRPKSDEDMPQVKVTVPRIETLLKITGTVRRPVEHLVFKDLSFEETNWHRVNNLGLIEGQAGFFNHFSSWDNFQLFGRPPAAVALRGCRHLRFERNQFVNLGATALDLEFATYATEIEGNRFSDIAGTAIRHGTFSPPEFDHHFIFNPSDEREICTNDRIVNNYLTNAGADYLGNVGIVCGFVRGVQIEHNRIEKMPYSGISLGWGWDARPNAMRDNRIRYNDISKVVQQLHDGGAVYTLSPQHGTEIAFNYLHDIHVSQWTTDNKACGIFFDEKTDYAHCHHNVMRSVDRPYLLHANGPQNKVENDVLIDPELEAHEEMRDIKTQAGSKEAVLKVLKVATPNEEAIISEAGLEPAYQDIIGRK